jgi:hypothetical protein
LITEKGSINCQRVTERVFDFIAPIASFNRIQPDHAVCLDEFGIQRCLVFIVHGAVQGFAGVGDLWTSATCFLNALLREVVAAEGLGVAPVKSIPTVRACGSVAYPTMHHNAALDTPASRAHDVAHMNPR